MPFGDEYFGFIKRVRELLGKSSEADDEEDFLAMCNDVNWWGCFDDGMTPEQAVEEYRRKVLD